MRETGVGEEGVHGFDGRGEPDGVEVEAPQEPGRLRLGIQRQAGTGEAGGDEAVDAVGLPPFQQVLPSRGKGGGFGGGVGPVHRRAPAVVGPLRTLRDPGGQERDLVRGQRVALAGHPQVGIACPHHAQQGGGFRVARDDEAIPAVGRAAGVEVGVEPDPTLQGRAVVALETVALEEGENLRLEVGTRQRDGKKPRRKCQADAAPALGESSHPANYDRKTPVGRPLMSRGAATGGVPGVRADGFAMARRPCRA